MANAEAMHRPGKIRQRPRSEIKRHFQQVLSIEPPEKMASNWRSRLFPTIKRVFVFGSSKKTAATEACKSFEESQEELTKEFEERKIELEAKAVEIYQASDAEIKDLVKNPTEAGIKKKSTAVVKFIEELVKIEFPGSKQVSEAVSKYGVALVPAPIVFILEKVSALVPQDDEVDPTGAKEATSSELESEKEEAAVVAEKAEEATIAASSPPSPVGNAPAATISVTAEPTPPEMTAAKTTVAAPEQPAKA